MSLSTLFFLLSGAAMYRLGAFNERHPGRTRAWLWNATVWTWKSLNK
jgi:hypothetical protein